MTLMHRRIALVVVLLSISAEYAGIGEDAAQAAPADTPTTETVSADRAAVPLGFSPQSYAAQARWEKRFLEIPSAAKCRKYLRRLTRQPHVAGTRELLAVIEGEVTLSVSGEEIVLYPGDAASFHGDAVHGYRNDDATAARFALTVYEPAGPR